MKALTSTRRDQRVPPDRRILPQQTRLRSGGATTAPHPGTGPAGAALPHRDRPHRAESGSPHYSPTPRHHSTRPHRAEGRLPVGTVTDCHVTGLTGAPAAKYHRKMWQNLKDRYQNDWRKLGLPCSQLKHHRAADIASNPVRQRRI